LVKGAAASEAHVAQAAREMLDRGNAVDAVIAGVMVAAAETPTVLLGPLQVLVGGGGAGFLAIDGRVRQPGRGAPRPRGFLAGELVPDASRIAVPMLPATVAALVATLGSATLYRACAPALAWAKGRSPERAAFLEAFARRGAPALSEDAVAAELLASVGRAARGLLTRDDLTSAVPQVTRHDERSFEPSGIFTAPWAAATHDGSCTHVVAAIDAQGLAALACYEAPTGGVTVPALGVVAPRGAEPVMRGTTRVAPGQPRPAASPLALRTRRTGVELALGVAAHPDAERSVQAIAAVLDESLTVADALRAGTDGRAIAIVRTRDTVRVLTSA
jgi:gamma-glutamyltranspeptidase/glutathione hydrolase